MMTRNLTSWLLILALTASPVASFAMPFFCGSQEKSCCCGSKGSCDKPVSSEQTVRRAAMCCPVMATLDTRMQIVRTEVKEVVPTFDLTADAADVVYISDPSLPRRTVPDDRMDRPSGRDRTIFLQTFLI